MLTIAAGLDPLAIEYQSERASIVISADGLRHNQRLLLPGRERLAAALYV